ncbi:MAG: hypothetical protein IKI02_01180, partial [Oscillospiraceae bacterium]|nr:hypothetical protein [Oscillospiraceae bacterium]
TFNLFRQELCHTSLSSLPGVKPACVLRLVWRNSCTKHSSIFLWEFSIIRPFLLPENAAFSCAAAAALALAPYSDCMNIDCFVYFPLTGSVQGCRMMLQQAQAHPYAVS